MTIRRALGLGALLAAVVLLLWQCTGSPDPDEPPAAVTVFGPWLGEEAEAFVAVLDQFEQMSGIEVAYTGSSDFDGDLRRRIGGGLSLPDVAIIPQPALFAEMVAQGVLRPLGETTVETMLANLPVTLDQVSIDGEVYLAPYRSNIKSLVWYRSDVWDENGWSVPATLDELGDFVDELAAAGTTPWCFSLEAGAVTGWAATDWVEDLVLRRGGPAAYDEWLAGIRPFDDDVIREAFTEFDELVLSPGHLAGGTQRAVSVDVARASMPLFADPSGCVMYKQGTFATSWFPEGTEIGPDGDVDFFVLPGVESGEPPPLLIGSDSLVRFSDGESVDALLTFLSSPEGAQAWIDRGGYLSTRRGVELEDYAETDRRFAEVAEQAEVLRLDASDSLLTSVREVLLEEITTFVAQTNFALSGDVLDGLVQRVDAEVENLESNNADP